MADPEGTLAWHRVADVGALPEGRVTTVQAGHRSLALTRMNGSYGALDNRCPHQGGPLGEGSIEKGLLRCPWHGYDYDPLTGTPPPPFTDAPVLLPGRGARPTASTWASRPSAEHVRTVSDVMAETMVEWGVTHVFGMVGHSNLGFADAIRRQEEAGRLTFVGIRHEGAASFAASAYGKLTGRPAACLAIAGPGSTNLLTGLYDAKVDRAPVLAVSGQVPSKVLGRGAFQDLDLTAAFGDVAAFSRTVQRGLRPRRADVAGAEARAARPGVAHLVLPDEVQNLPAAPGAAPVGPAGRLPELTVAARRGRRWSRRSSCIRAARRPVIIVGHGARHDVDDVVRLAEALGTPGGDDLQGEGPDPGRPPARRRRARPERHAGRELADERVGPPARDRRLVRGPHRDLALQADGAGGLATRWRSGASRR